MMKIQILNMMVSRTSMFSSQQYTNQQQCARIAVSAKIRIIYYTTISKTLMRAH